MKQSTVDTIKGIALVNVATCAWATNIMLGRFLRGRIGPLTLTASRYAVAALVFAALLRSRPAEERRPGSDWKTLLAMTLTGVVAFAPLLYFGLRFTTAVNGTLMNGLAPLLTGAFAALIIKEPFSGRQIAGSVAALAGVAVLMFGNAGAASFSVNPGDLLILVAVLSWALYSVMTRRVVKHRSPLSATALTIFMGLPLLAVAAVVESIASPIEWSLQLAGFVVYIGLVPAALGFFSWNAGIKYLGAGGAMVFYNTLPIFGALFGFLFLGERLGPSHLVGGLLILGGGLFAAIRRRERSK